MLPCRAGITSGLRSGQRAANTSSSFGVSSSCTTSSSFSCDGKTSSSFSGDDGKTSSSFSTAATGLLLFPPFPPAGLVSGGVGRFGGTSRTAPGHVIAADAASPAGRQARSAPTSASVDRRTVFHFVVQLHIVGCSHKQNKNKQFTNMPRINIRIKINII